MADPENEAQLVPGLIQLRTHADALVAGPFESNTDFRDAVKAAFEDVLNQNSNRIAQLLAKFVDANMKSRKIVRVPYSFSSRSKFNVAFASSLRVCWVCLRHRAAQRLSWTQRWTG